MTLRILILILLVELPFVACAQLFEPNRDTGSFRDPRDQQRYKWVRIDGKTWMAENLNFATSTGSICYNSEKTMCAEYGKLYNWKAAMNACPEGWHLPNDDEWTELSDFLGDQASDMLRGKGLKHWLPPNDGATTGFSGFDARAAGTTANISQSMSAIDFADLHKFAIFWTATPENRKKAWTRVLSYKDEIVRRFSNYNEYGYSVRCVRDREP